MAPLAIFWWLDSGAAVNELGFGFLECVYASAPEMVLREHGLSVHREQKLEVMFRGKRLGVLRADLVVEDLLVLELKAGAVLPQGAKAQLLSYLKASRKEVGLLLFVGPIPKVQRATLSRQ